MAEAAAAAARSDYDAALAIWVELCARRRGARAGRDRPLLRRRPGASSATSSSRRKWLKLAAKAGDPLGQRLLGDFYFNGEDGTPDRAIAEEWYARAAKQGEPTRRTCCPGS